MSIMIIMSLILVLFQGARIGAVKMKTECVMDIGMNSILAEYSRELYEQYGLLMVDTSYGTGRHTIVNTEEHLRHYIQKNCSRATIGGITNAQTILSMYCEDARITGSSFAMDNNGAVLNRQILAYMGSEPAEGMLTDVYENAETIKDNELDTRDVEEEASAVQEELDEYDGMTFTDDDGNEQTISIGNPADVVNIQKRFGVLNLAIKDKDRISKTVINPGDYVSEREQNHGTGLRDGEDLSLSERALLEQYYYEKCSRYGNELEKSLLKYQLEYMIYGQDSDWENLEKMTEYLFFVREASNALYLFNCQAKVNEVKTIVEGILSLIPFIGAELAKTLGELLSYSILFAWTFAESVHDINILLDGGRVPLLKSDSTWQLSLGEMFFFSGHLNGGDCGEGLHYEDYVRARLLAVDPAVKTMRLANIIEMDIRKTEGNAQFMIDHCLDILRAEVKIGTRYGYECRIERVYGYEE